MKQRPRIYYTETDKALMWDRWQKGESLNAIARLFDRHHSAIQGILSRTGGIRPPERRRARLALTLAEREEISRGVAAEQSLRSIASTLGRAPSTISREINRNGGRRQYRANKADEAAWERAHRPKTCKLAQNRALARIVARKLQCRWSPRQIAGWLKRTYPDDENFQVSHETIYLTLFIQARGALKKELLKHLRRTRGMRRSRHHTQKTTNHGRITDTVSIRERPAEVEDRALHFGLADLGSLNDHEAEIDKSSRHQSRVIRWIAQGGVGIGAIVDDQRDPLLGPNVPLVRRPGSERNARRRPNDGAHERQPCRTDETMVRSSPGHCRALPIHPCRNVTAGMHGILKFVLVKTWFTEGFDTADLKDAKALLDELN